MWNNGSQDIEHKSMKDRSLRNGKQRRWALQLTHLTACWLSRPWCKERNPQSLAASLNWGDETGNLGWSRGLEFTRRSIGKRSDVQREDSRDLQRLLHKYSAENQLVNTCEQATWGRGKIHWEGWKDTVPEVHLRPEVVLVPTDWKITSFKSHQLEY